MGTLARGYGYDPVPLNEDDGPSLEEQHEPPARILCGHRTRLAVCCGAFGLLVVVLALISL